MRNNLLVTLANENYIDQAKQLFSSVYFNSGWKGDYMLLAYEIPDEKLAWFKDKGILIKKCRVLHRGRFGTSMHPVVTSKFFLFTPEFKKWKSVVYLDADIIVRSSLDRLTKIKRFAAGSEVTSMKLRQHFVRKPIPGSKELLEKLEKDYDLQSKAFNSGVMAFNTDVIKDDSFDTLIKLSKEYPGVNGDQRIFNLYFYKNWEKLPPVYNFLIFNERNQSRIPPHSLKSIVLHFINVDKPWVTKNYFYNEWKNNVDRADRIDLQRRPKGTRWSTLKVVLISISIELKKYYHCIFLGHTMPRWRRRQRFIKNKLNKFKRKLKKI